MRLEEASNTLLFRRGGAAILLPLLGVVLIALTTVPDAQSLPGDPTGDGAFATNDIICIARHVAEMDLDGTPCSADAAAMDVNCDGVVATNDIVFIARLVAGLSLGSAMDTDGDGIHNGCDTCPLVANANQALNPCDDGNLCNGLESCNAESGCVSGTALNCDDGNFCNGVETCDGSDGCIAGTPPILDDGITCTIDTCDEAADQVLHTLDHGVCDNGLFCDGVETCDAISDCMAGIPPVVNDEVACTEDVCDEDLNQVVHTPVDSACEDDQFCTGVETCDASLGCQATNVPAVGTACDDSEAITNNDICTPIGTCAGTAPLLKPTLISTFDFTVPGVYDLQGKDYIYDPNTETLEIGKLTGDKGSITIKNGRIILMDEAVLTDEGNGLYSFPYDFSAEKSSTQVQVWDPSSEQFPRMAQYPPPPHPDMRVSWTYTSSWWSLTVPDDQVFEHLLHNDDDHFVGFVLATDTNPSIQAALRTALDQVINDDPTITTREQAALGAGLQLMVYPNQIHTTTIASYDDGGGSGDITIMLKKPRTFNTHYLRFAIFGRASWLVGDDNVYTMDITNNKILYKPKSGKTVQVFHTPQVVGSYRSAVTVAFDNPLTLENITLVGGRGNYYQMWRTWPAVNGSIPPLSRFIGCEFLLGFNGVGAGSVFVDGCLFDGQISYQLGLGNHGPKNIVKNSRFVNVEQNTSISGLGQTGQFQSPTEIHGNYFSVPFTNHGQAISMYNGKWTNADIHHNIFHNCKRPLALQFLPMVVRLNLTDITGEIKGGEAITVGGLSDTEVVRFAAYNNNELVLHYHFKDAEAWEALADSGVAVTQGDTFSATTTNKQFGGARADDALTGLRLENNLIYYDMDIMKYASGQAGVNYNSSGDEFRFLNGNGASIIVRGNTFLLSEELIVSEPKMGYYVGLGLGNSDDLAVTVSGNMLTQYGAPSQRPGGTDFSLFQGHNVNLNATKPYEGSGTAFSAQDKFRTQTGMYEDSWLLAQQKIIDPDGFGLNPALSAEDKSYYSTVGIQWSSYPTRADLTNLPRDWALTHTALPLPDYKQSETAKGLDDRPYKTATKLKGRGTPINGSSLMTPGTVTTDIDELSSGQHPWLDPATGIYGWDDGIYGTYYKMLITPEWVHDAFPGFDSWTEQFAAVNGYLTEAKVNFYVDGILDSSKPSGVKPSNVFPTYWRFYTLEPSMLQGGFPFDGKEVTFEVVEQSPNKDCSAENNTCDDGHFCNGVETCDESGGCLPGTPPVLDDGIACTDDTCDETTDQVVHTPVCDNGVF